MLKIEHVQKKYNNFSMDCSLEVKPGMITGLIGRNGAGKTTLFKAVMGLVSIDGGKIEVFGNAAGKLMKKEDKQKICIAFSDSGFNGYLNVKDCAAIFANMYPKFDTKSFFEKCKELDIPDTKQIKDFSTGMKAKLKVVVALSTRAELIILDEPTVGLDVIVREKILNLIREYMEQNEENAIIISSHIASDIENLCDDIYMINDGKIVFHEDTDELLSNYGVLKVDKNKYDKLDKKYILKYTKENYGYCCLTNQKKYYIENYPDIVIENGGIDELMIMMNGGK